MSYIFNITDSDIDMINNILPIISSILVISTLIPQIIFSAVRKKTNDLSYISLFINLASHINIFIYGLLVNEWGFYIFAPFSGFGVIILIVLKCLFDKKQLNTLKNFNDNIKFYLESRNLAINSIVNIINIIENININNTFSFYLIKNENIIQDIIYIWSYVNKIDENVTFDTKIKVFIKNILRDINNISVNNNNYVILNNYYKIFNENKK